MTERESKEKGRKQVTKNENGKFPRTREKEFPNRIAPLIVQNNDHMKTHNLHIIETGHYEKSYKLLGQRREG